jgi:hypothetical protein
MKLNKENQHQRLARLRREDLEKIVDDLNKAIVDSHENAQLHYQLGMAYEALERFKEAVDAYYLSLFFSKKPGNIFFLVKLRIKIKKLERKLEKEEVSYEGPLLFQIWLHLKGVIVFLLLTPLWLLMSGHGGSGKIILKSLNQTGSSPFFVLHCLINLILLYEVLRSLISRFGYNLKYKLTFIIIKICVFIPAIPLGIHTLSLITGKVDFFLINVAADKNTIPIYVVYICFFLLESLLQLMNALIKMKYFRVNEKLGLFYNPEEVYIETFNYLDDSEQRKFTKADVRLILKLKDKYKKKFGHPSLHGAKKLNPSRKVSKEPTRNDKMYRYIQSEAKKKGLEVTGIEVRKILIAEETCIDYMHQIYN